MIAVESWLQQQQKGKWDLQNKPLNTQLVVVTKAVFFLSMGKTRPNMIGVRLKSSHSSRSYVAGAAFIFCLLLHSSRSSNPQEYTVLSDQVEEDTNFYRNTSWVSLVTHSHVPTYTIQYVSDQVFRQKMSMDEDMDPCKARESLNDIPSSISHTFCVLKRFLWPFFGLAFLVWLFLLFWVFTCTISNL